jgi:hypothetical protein
MTIASSSKGDRDPQVDRLVDGEFGVAAADVLHEGVPGDHDSPAAVGLEPAHRPDPPGFGGAPRVCPAS